MASRQLDEEAIFHIARQLTAAEARATYLDQVCAGDAHLRDRVEALLRVHDRDREFLNSGQSPPLTQDPAPTTEGPGKEIGRYKLLQRIGEGGFGVVYMADQQRPIRRKVALKIIKPGMDSAVVIARFEAERQALALMDHPNIARVFDGGETDSGRPYFVMELVKGVPLTEYCDQNQLTLADRLEMFLSVCQAVQHAHQKGIIHRDLKPSNVLITLHDGQPVVKVIDFGIAKAINQQLTEKTLFTAFGQMVGTPQYMSPEQAEMSGLDVDTRSDIYSLGVILYELLTDTTPLEAERLRTAGYAEVQRLIREEEPPKPSTRLSSSGERLTIIAKHRGVTPERLNGQIRGDLDWIVMKALEKDRSRRYETASGLAADVCHFLQDEPVIARRPSTAYRMKKFVRRNTGLVAAVITIMGILCLGVVATSLAMVQAWKDQSRLADALAQLRTIALDRAITDTLAGNQAQATAAIELAQTAGVSGPWLEILHAERDCYDGRPEVAVRRLETVVANLAEEDAARIAALSSLALAHASAGHDPRYIEYMEQVYACTPHTPEDYLFLAKAESSWVGSLAALDVAMQTRPTPTALFTRALTRINQAFDTGDYGALEGALKDLEYVELFVGKTPAVLANLVLAHRAAYELTRRTDSAKAEKHLASLKVYVEQLRKIPDYLFGSLAIMNFYFCIDDYQSLSEVSQNVNYRDTVFIEYAAAAIYAQSDNPTHSLNQFQSLRFDRNNPSAMISEAHFLAESPDGREQLIPLFDQLKTLHANSSQVRYRSLCILALLGDAARLKGEALELKLSQNSGLKYWGMEEAIMYLAGDVDEQGLLLLAGPSHGKQCAARYVCGLQMLAKGDRQKAREQFTECVNTGVCGWFEYNWSKAFLARIDHDSKWPEWIK